MHAAILLGILAAAAFDAQDAKSRYELKCLYCHSASTVESEPRDPRAWRDLLEQMRHKAPMLVSRQDVRIIYRYLATELHLVARGGRRAPAAAASASGARARPPFAPPRPDDAALPPDTGPD